MTAHVEYNGYLIEPITKLKGTPAAWTLEVKLTPIGRRTGVRRCRAPNTFASEEVAIGRCLEFGRRVVDGTARRRDAGAS